MANHPHDKNRPTPKWVQKVLGDPEKLKKALTVRQVRFCEEYIHDYNGKAAAVRAGYASTWADRQANQLMKNEGVVAYIDHLTQSRATKIESVDPDYVIKKVTEIINNSDAKDSDKLRGLEMMARYLGMFIDRQEITGKDGEAIEIKQRTEQEAQDFMKSLKRLRKPDLKAVK